MWVIVGVTAIAVAIGFLLFRTARLNGDPVQQELSELILEMMANGADESAQTLFAVSSQRVFIMSMIPPEQQQNRLAHALSLANAQLNPTGQAVARGIIRSMR